jgi:hypothetical protein
MDVNITQDLNCMLGIASSNGGPRGVYPGEFGEHRRLNLCSFCTTIFQGVSNYGMKFPGTLGYGERETTSHANMPQGYRDVNITSVHFHIRQMQEVNAKLFGFPTMFEDLNVDNNFGIYPKIDVYVARYEEDEVWR